MSNCYSFFFGVQLWILANRFFHLKNREAVFVWGAHVWELSTIYTGNLSSCDPMIGKIKKISLYFQGLDLAAKPSSKVGLSSSAQVRKRLSRKSPGPELRKTLRSIPPPTNVTGPETVCSPPVHFSPLFSHRRSLILSYHLHGLSMESFHIHSNSHSEFCYFNFQSSVAWTSQIFRWLYSDLVIVNDLLQSWVQALNEHSKKNAEEVSKSNSLEYDSIRMHFA